MKSIQSKILFVVIAALVVITTLVSLVAVTVTHEIMHQDADRILNNVSQKEAALINDMLNDFVKSSTIMEHYAAHSLESPERLRDADYLAEYTLGLRHLFDEVAANTSGTSSYYLCFSPELTEKTSGFYTKVYGNGEKHELSEAEFSALTLISDEELIEYSNADGTVGGSWVQPHPSRFTREMVVSYVIPIYSAGRFIGILGFNMDFNYLLDRVNSIAVYEHGCALLLGEDQTTYYNISASNTIEGEYTKATTPLTCGMGLELRVAYKDIQSGIRPMLAYIVLAFVAVFVLAVLYTLWVTQKIVKPLKKLTQAAASVSTTTQEVDLVVDSNDEIGTLSRVLHDTYGKIREYSTYINALAYRDSLTGIKNSTAYAEAIAELDKKINLGTPAFGVLVVDINDLKKTNDTYGHDVGNELIVHAAKLLSTIFKASATFRIGGDEFVVVLDGKDLKNYHALIEKLDAAFAEDYISVDDNTIPVSAARGVAIFDGAVDRTFGDVFAKADHAMYMHKEAAKAALN